MKKLELDSMLAISGGSKPGISQREWCIISNVCWLACSTATALIPGGQLLGVGGMMASTTGILAC
jgi:hypothetical protein